MLTAARSLIDPAALAGFLTLRYGLAVDSCVLIRSFVNDVYRASGESGELLIKVYRAGGLSASRDRLGGAAQPAPGRARDPGAGGAGRRRR